MELAKDVTPALLVALGAFFLFREVWIAQTFERLSGEATLLGWELQPVKEMAELFRTNKREFVIRAVADTANRPYGDVERLYQDADAAMIEAEAAKYAAFWVAVPQRVRSFEEARRRLEQFLAPKTLRTRRRLLCAGFVLLMLSAALEVAVAISRHS